jgi:hypothetical protein
MALKVVCCRTAKSRQLGAKRTLLGYCQSDAIDPIPEVAAASDVEKRY